MFSAKGVAGVGHHGFRRRRRLVTVCMPLTVGVLLCIWLCFGATETSTSLHIPAGQKAPLHVPQTAKPWANPGTAAAGGGEGLSEEQRSRAQRAEVSLNPFVPTPTRAESYNEDIEMSEGWEPIIVTHAIAGGVEMRFPLVRTRDRLQAPVGHGPQHWRAKHTPKEAYRMPEWASIEERNTLRHASVFVSIAAFRDAECATTLSSALRNAASPHRVYAGISEERRPSDTSCLSELQLTEDPTGSTARRLLYGMHAPVDLPVLVQRLTWADILRDPVTGKPTNISIELAAAAPESATRAPGVPSGIYMEDTFMATDEITCVYSAVERERDRMTVGASADVRVREVRVRKGLRRGPQEKPAAALAGCRVVTRVTPATSARGPTFGRYVTSLFFFHQDYYMVVDSHSRFPRDWDLKMIARVFQMPTRGVLSHYPNGYTPEEPEKEYEQAATMSMCKGVIIANGMPKLGARWMPMTDAPVIDAFAAAGYMFGDAQYVLDVPFDPFLPYLFDGEEILYSARMWTSGYDMYAPGQPNIFHHYLRKDTPKFWSLVTAREARQRVTSEQRALFLLQRAHPWAEELRRRSKVSPIMESAQLYVPPARRRIVTVAVADRTPMIGIERRYYGMGTSRTLDAYWHHTQLTDNFVKKKDNEDRWEGGTGLCDSLPQ